MQSATPGGDTSLVSGSIAPATTPITVDPFVYAPPIAAAGAFADSGTFNSGVYRYTSFNVPGGKSVTFNGDVELYVDGKFTISGSGFATLAPNAHVVGVARHHVGYLVQVAERARGTERRDDPVIAVLDQPERRDVRLTRRVHRRHDRLDDSRHWISPCEQL